MNLLNNLLTFANRRPGIDPRDYGWGLDGLRAYRADARRVTRDLHRVRVAYARAVLAGVTDADILDATQGDRLSITPDGTIDYCVGQYFPTEYRAAVTRVLERAVRARGHTADIAVLRDLMEKASTHP